MGVMTRGHGRGSLLIQTLSLLSQSPLDVIPLLLAVFLYRKGEGATFWRPRRVFTWRETGSEAEGVQVVGVREKGGWCGERAKGEGQIRISGVGVRGLGHKTRKPRKRTSEVRGGATVERIGKTEAGLGVSVVGGKRRRLGPELQGGENSDAQGLWETGVSGGGLWEGGRGGRARRALGPGAERSRPGWGTRGPGVRSVSGVTPLP